MTPQEIKKAREANEILSKAMGLVQDLMQDYVDNTPDDKIQPPEIIMNTVAICALAVANHQTPHIIEYDGYQEHFWEVVRSVMKDIDKNGGE